MKKLAKHLVGLSMLFNAGVGYAGEIVPFDATKLDEFTKYVGAAINLNNNTDNLFDVSKMKFRSLDSKEKLPNLMCETGNESQPYGIDYDMIQIKLAQVDEVKWASLAGSHAAYNVMKDKELDAQWAVLYLRMLPVAVVVKDGDKILIADQLPRYNSSGKLSYTFGPCQKYM